MISLNLLVTAHPDDESMFFIPTLRHMLSPNPNEPNYKNKKIVHALCLSNGDYRDTSDGPIRTKEMHAACSIIGIDASSLQNSSSTDGTCEVSSVTVLDDDRMRDGPNEVWATNVVAKTVLEYLQKAVPSLVQQDIQPSDKTEWKFMDHTAKRSTSSADTEDNNYFINVNLLTFDERGVSGHPNHVDVFKGIRFLFDEKCRQISDKSNRISSTLTLLHGDSRIELNVRVLTLQTISNPLKKYFFWVFQDMIFYLMVWALQMVSQLVYFLLGGWVWGSQKQSALSQVQPFFRVKTTSDGAAEYRIMEPLLVWRAMAAHRSQFVWYRRLSVLFSRYTYINDIVEIQPDTQGIQPQQQDDDGDTSSLPPVVTLQEDKESPNYLIDPLQMTALREEILPAALHHRPWKRIYSLSRDGDSFVAFQQLISDWNRGSGGHSTLLIVKTTSGSLIGGYSGVPYFETVANPSGSSASSCLFRINTENESRDTASIVTVYGKYSTSASKRIVFDATRNLIAFGGGNGGEDEGFGLSLEDGFARGTTAKCEVFGNDPLVDTQGGVFDVVDVEVWGFVFGQF